MSPSSIAGAPAIAPSTEGGVTVRPDLMARLGVAARLSGSIVPPVTPTDTGKPIRTERLTLRPLEAHDRAEFLRVVNLSRRHLDEFCPLSNSDPRDPAPPESAEDIFTRHLALGIAARQTGRAWRTVALDRDGRIVGAFNVNDITRGLEHTGELVFWLGADALRRGYAEEGVRASLAHAFADLPEGLGLHRVSALISPGNTACARLARKVGLALAIDAPPTVLRLGGRAVTHSVYEVFAAIDDAIAPSDPRDGGVVEGKPSIAETLFGRGLLSILRTEGARPFGHEAA